jgi:hypothetical protein
VLVLPLLVLGLLLLVVVLLLMVVLLLVLEVEVEMGREDKMWRGWQGSGAVGDADTADAPAADTCISQARTWRYLFRCSTLRVYYAVSARTRLSLAVIVAETTLRSPWARSALMSCSAISARILALSATRTRCSLQRAHASG